MKLYNIGIENLAKYDIRMVARPFMEELAQKLRFTVHLAILSNGRAVYIEKVNGPTFVQFRYENWTVDAYSFLRGRKGASCIFR